MELNVPEVTFRFDVPKVSALKECFSPEFGIQGVPWKVGIYKSDKNNEQYLVVSLVCANKQNSPDWSYTAYATFELLSFSSKHIAFKKSTSPNVFDYNESCWDRWLIKWSDLFDAAKKYVKNDTISLKVTVVVANPNDKSKSQLIFKEIRTRRANDRSTKYRLTIKKADNLLAVRSSQFSFQNAPWYLVVFKDHNNKFGIRLECRNYDQPEFLTDLKISVKLVAQEADVRSIEQTKTSKLKYNQNLAIKSFASWDHVFNRRNGFVKNNSIVIEVQLEPHRTSGSIDTNANNVPTQRFELECAICLQRFEGQEVSFTPCGHMFCSKCIEDTLKVNRKACPVCNRNVSIPKLKRAHLPFSA